MIKKTRFRGKEFAVRIVRTYVRWIDVELEDLVNMVIDLSDDVTWLPGCRLQQYASRVM